MTEYTCPDDSSHCIKYADLCNSEFSNSDCVHTVCNNEISMLIL